MELLKHKTLGKAFLEKACSIPQRPTLLSEQESLTYGQTLHLASGLAELVSAITCKNKIGIMLPTSPWFGISFWAVHFAGKIPVPLNYLLDSTELDYIVKDSDLDTIIASQVFKEKLPTSLRNPLILEELRSKFPSKPNLGNGSRLSTNPNDLAVILYTSGTTGNPKGVMLSHQNLLSNVSATGQAFHLNEKDVFLGVLPMFHSFALNATFLLPQLFGLPTLYHPRFVPTQVYESVEKFNVSVLLAVPSMYRLLVKVAQRKEAVLPSLRIAMAGGEPLPDDLRQNFEATFKLPLLEGYGLTETSPVVSFNPPEANRPGTAGRPLSNLEIAIFDSKGNPLPRNTEGEITVRGPSIMQGYLNKPEATKDVLDDDGWFRTGDLGLLDDAGYVKITGRAKDLIISSGENISPAEIEYAIESHPDVFEAAVIGVKDEQRGEIPAAFVALHENKTLKADDLKEFLKGKIAPYKIPKHVEFLSALPHGPTGKILKRALKEKYARK